MEDIEKKILEYLTSEDKDWQDDREHVRALFMAWCIIGNHLVDTDTTDTMLWVIYNAYKPFVKYFGQVERYLIKYLV